MYLEPAAQRECRALDGNVAAMEREEQITPTPQRVGVQARLLVGRKCELSC